MVDYVLKPAERERLAVTVRAHPEAAGARAAATRRTPAAARRRLQQLLHQLSAQLNPGGAPSYLHWIQATVGQAIQMIPVDDVLFFISDEKYTRVQTAQLEALIRKPIKELVDELDPQLFWQIHRSHAGQREGDRRRDARLARPPDRQREGPPREARGEPQLHRAVQGDVGAAGFSHDAISHCAAQ